MSSLLIYNDNISPDFVSQFKSHVGEVKSFTVSNQTLAKENYSFDSVVSEFLLNFPTFKYDVIFIPINLSSENYLEFSGLKIGYHIRMTKDLINQETPIIFLGKEDAYEINKLTTLGEILFTPQVYLTDKMDIIHLISQVKFTRTIKSENVLENFLKKIHINPSGNYATHHSIANEWSIMRWTKALNLSKELNYTPDEIEKIEEKIGSNLYYKYLSLKFPLDSSKVMSKESLKLKNTGKVLYIDDDLDKGWNELFCYLLNDGDLNTVEEFNSIGDDFNELNQEEIIDISFEKAKEADLVILDFRLHDNDYYETDPKQITGYKILEKIKEFNPGIQVIIFSASNKIWNLQALQDAESDGFIIKESPENSVDPEFTKESIKNIITTVDRSLSMRFLKSFFQLMDEIQSHFDINSETLLNTETAQFENIYSMFQNEIIYQMEIAFDCLTKSNSSQFSSGFNQKYLDLTMISLYKILELFNNEFIADPKKITKKFTGENLNVQYPSTLDKISYIIKSVLNMDFHLFRDDMIRFNDIRKDIIHPVRTRRTQKAKTEDCLQFAQIIKQLVLRTN